LKGNRTRARLLLPAFAALAYILWPRFRGAPWAPTSRRTIRNMLALANVRPGDTVYDLGSGDGRIPLMAARRFGARAVGIEIDPLFYLWTRFKIVVLGQQGRVRLVRGDLFDQDLSQADVVTCYLLPRTNERLVGKLEQELRPGTRVVSRRFQLPGWSPVRQDDEARLYVYEIGDKSLHQRRELAVRSILTEPRTAKPQRPRPAHLSKPGLIVFLSSACLMVLELVAERIIAPHVGMSLNTWTSIIGVVLAGMSLGNYLGGRMADQRASPRLLGSILLLGGVTALPILAADRLGFLTAVEWPFILKILIVITSLFFLPATILGAVSPIVAKLVISDLTRTGRVLGRIYAAGSVGSIVGTLATGFLLVPWFATHIIVYSVAGLLILLGLLLILRARRDAVFSRNDLVPPAVVHLEEQ
jgi:SAM-dependent methyltransferase